MTREQHKVEASSHLSPLCSPARTLRKVCRVNPRDPRSPLVPGRTPSPGPHPNPSISKPGGPSLIQLLPPLPLLQQLPKPAPKCLGIAAACQQVSWWPPSHLLHTPATAISVLLNRSSLVATYHIEKNIIRPPQAYHVLHGPSSSSTPAKVASWLILEQAKPVPPQSCSLTVLA